MTGAVRREGMKESGIRQFIISRLSSFFSSCLSRIRWKLLLWKIDYFYWDVERQRKNYCTKGFHKLGRCKITAHHGKRTYSVEYLQCNFCGWKFFSTAEDKRIYLKLKSTHRKAQREMFKELFKRQKRERIKNAKGSN